MTGNAPTLWYAPRTRASGVLMLLHELGAEYELQVVDTKDGAHRTPAFLAINPLGKVPALVHDGALITEQPAIYLYLSELFPDRGLAPPVGNPERGPFLRWLAFYGGAFEPAMVDRAQKREPGYVAMSPYGSHDAVVEALHLQLGDGPWMLGNRFTAVDVLWGTALNWMTAFGILERTAALGDYIDRVTARPSFAFVTGKDRELAAAAAPAAATPAARS